MPGGKFLRSADIKHDDFLVRNQLSRLVGIDVVDVGVGGAGVRDTPGGDEKLHEAFE